MEQEIRGGWWWVVVGGGTVYKSPLNSVWVRAWSKVRGSQEILSQLSLLP